MKDRVWFCPCCRRSDRRYLKGTARWQPSRCGRCHLDLVPGFGYKVQRACRHVRAARKVAALRERLRTRVRTQAQRVYSPDAATRAAWREVRRARTRPAIVRRGQAWLDLLLARGLDAGPDDWTQTIYRDGTIHKSRATWTTSPAIRLMSGRGGSLLGTYRRSWVRSDYSILLAPDQSVDEMRRTLVHEALHVLDDRAGMARGTHDRLWAARLAMMDRWFPADEARRR